MVNHEEMANQWWYWMQETEQPLIEEWKNCTQEVFDDVLALFSRENQLLLWLDIMIHYPVIQPLLQNSRHVHIQEWFTWVELGILPSMATLVEGISHENTQFFYLETVMERLKPYILSTPSLGKEIPLCF